MRLLKRAGNRSQVISHETHSLAYAEDLLTSLTNSRFPIFPVLLTIVERTTSLASLPSRISCDDICFSSHTRSIDRHGFVFGL